MTVQFDLLGAPEVRARLAEVPRKIRPALRREFLKLAQPMMAEMRSDASAYSTRIPRSISLSTRWGFSTARVTIISRGSVAPHNTINERGGRHPVFGNRDVWVYQPARPYFYKAAKGKTTALRAAGQRALAEALS